MKKIGYCESCQSEDLEVEAYSDQRNWPKSEGKTVDMCEVCAGTLLGNAFQYPALYQKESHLYMCVAQCTNMILKAIREEKNR